MRTPHPVILRYRAHINVVALGLIALGLMTVFDPRLQLWGAATILGTILAWIWLRSRIRPNVADYLEYLESRAEEEGQGSWLCSANQGFKELWGVRRLEEVGEP